MITERLVEFWETNVLDGQEPVIDGSEATSEFLKEKNIRTLRKTKQRYLLLLMT